MSMINSNKTVSPAKISKGRPRIDAETCKGCALCISVCPQGCLKFSAHSNSQGVPYIEYDSSIPCTACISCAVICPDCAIEVYRFERD